MCVPRGDERGQVVPLAALALVLFGAIAYGLTAVGTVLVDRATARTAADAVALELAASGDDAAARDLATANGAEVVGVQWDGPTVEVEVRVGRVTARARASSAVEWVPPPGGARPRGAIP
jgi:Flp pilus assembly protein TadG